MASATRFSAVALCFMGSLLAFPALAADTASEEVVLTDVPADSDVKLPEPMVNDADAGDRGFRSAGELSDYLVQHNVPGIEQVDTRVLTRAVLDHLPALIDAYRKHTT